jgi:hypothetical protein
MSSAENVGEEEIDFICMASVGVNLLAAHFLE